MDSENQRPWWLKDEKVEPKDWLTLINSLNDGDRFHVDVRSERHFVIEWRKRRNQQTQEMQIIAHVTLEPTHVSFFFPEKDVRMQSTYTDFVRYLQERVDRPDVEKPDIAYNFPDRSGSVDK